MSDYKIETHFKGQRRFVNSLIVFSLIIIGLTVGLSFFMTDVELFIFVLLSLDLIYTTIVLFKILIFAVRNIFVLRIRKRKRSKFWFLIYASIILIIAFRVALLIVFMSDGKFNILLMPRDTGIILCHSLFIVVNLIAIRADN